MKKESALSMKFSAKHWWTIIYTVLLYFASAIITGTVQISAPGLAGLRGWDYATLMSFNTIGGLISIPVTFLYAQYIRKHGVKWATLIFGLLYPLVKGAPDSGPHGKPFIGPFGGLKLSMRTLDESKCTEYRPYLSYNQRIMLTPGEAVSAEIPLSPMGMKYKKGESICLMLTTKPVDLPLEEMKLTSHGDYTFITGGEGAAYLQIPVV